MEPCAHHGTTPPCVDAVLAAGIARVVAGSRDPNPEAGGGLERLEARGCRGRARRQRRGAAPERGLAHLGRAGAPVRHLQGRGHARRPRHRSRLALGLRSGIPPARPRAARRIRRRRGRHGHRAAREPRPRRPRRRRDAPAAAARVRHRPAPRRLRARAARRAARGRARGRSRRRASSRSCSRAGRRSPGPSSAPVSSTSSCSSSRRRSPAPGRASSTGSTQPLDARRPDEQADRRRRAPRGLPPRAVEL